MKRLILLLCLPTVLFASHALLTDAEADAIIAQKEAEAVARKVDTQALTVVDSKVVDLGNRTMTIEQIAPPADRSVLRKGKPVPVATAPVPVPIDLKFGTVEGFVTIYDHSISHIKWRDENGKQLSVWVKEKEDLSPIRSTGQFILGDTSYSILMMVQDVSSSELRDIGRIPSIPDSGGPIDYYVEAGDPLSPEFDGLDALLGYFAANKADLRVKFANQQKLAAAQKRYDAAHPKSKDTTIKFFVEERPPSK